MKCHWCEQEMTESVSCTVEPERVRHESDLWCYDCLCPPGGLHHPGCCNERCRTCGGQAIVCPCGREDEDE